MEHCDLVIIGGGPAGLAAAVSAWGSGVRDLIILEREAELGGILNQCVHSGFGLHTFKEELTGPEYAGRYIQKVLDLGVPYALETTVLELSHDRVVTAVSRQRGLFQLQAGAVILAMGCRERPRGALNIPGYRPSGIYSAGTAQRLVNREGYLPGREVVILGSGDIGLIMARRLTLEGAHVQAVAEIMPYSGGLRRNIVQCLDDFHIPLKLNHTVVDIQGRDRLTGVTLAQVDQDRRPIPGTQEHYNCDTLLLSVGLIPENELSRSAGVELSPATHGPTVDESLQTSVAGVFACGNVLYVHDLVDRVSQQADLAGQNAARFLAGETLPQGEGPRPAPRTPPPPPLSEGKRTLTCIRCPVGCTLTVSVENGAVQSVTGNTCKRGEAYARQEVTCPARVLTTTVPLLGGRQKRLPVRTAGEVPREKLMDCARSLSTLTVTAPVKTGDVVCRDILGTGVDLIAAADGEKA
jgi:CxxC motif-containing protein/thioredoxin reductase